MNRLERKRPQIDPTKIRKHSHIVAEKQDPLLVVGDRSRTDYGYTVSGVTTKIFETQYMAVVPNSATPTWLHSKKTRVYRVVAGSGYYQKLGSENPVTRPLSAGDEIVAEPGDTHRITAGAVKLELYVTQESKYESNLVEIAPVTSVADVDDSELATVTSVQKKLSTGERIPRRRSHRAAEQIALLRGDKTAIDRTAQNRDKEEKFLRNGASAGINAMPVMDFSDEGAG